jgi:hypothetical protein
LPAFGGGVQKQKKPTIPSKNTQGGKKSIPHTQKAPVPIKKVSLENTAVSSKSNGSVTRASASSSSYASQGSRASRILQSFSGGKSDEIFENNHRDDWDDESGEFCDSRDSSTRDMLAFTRSSKGSSSLISHSFVPAGENSEIGTHHERSENDMIIDPENLGLLALTNLNDAAVLPKKKKKLYDTQVAAGSFILNPEAYLKREACLKSSDLKIDPIAEKKLDQLPHSAGYRKKKMPGFSKVTDFVVYVADGVGCPVTLESVSAHIDIMFKVVLYTTSCCGYVVTPQMIRERAWSFLQMDKSASSGVSCPFTGIITNRVANFLAHWSELRFREAFGAKVIGMVTHRYESVRSYLTSFNGTVVSKLSFLEEKSTAALTTFLSECFEQQKFNCLESALLRLSTTGTAQDVENPLFILEKCAQVI